MRCRKTATPPSKSEICWLHSVNSIYWFPQHLIEAIALNYSHISPIAHHFLYFKLPALGKTTFNPNGSFNSPLQLPHPWSIERFSQPIDQYFQLLNQHPQKYHLTLQQKFPHSSIPFSNVALSKQSVLHDAYKKP